MAEVACIPITFYSLGSTRLFCALFARLLLYNTSSYCVFSMYTMNWPCNIILLYSRRRHYVCVFCSASCRHRHRKYLVIFSVVTNAGFVFSHKTRETYWKILLLFATSSWCCCFWFEDIWWIHNQPVHSDWYVAIVVTLCLRQPNEWRGECSHANPRYLTETISCDEK